MRWATWLETAERHVGRTELMGGEVLVSTVFLGLDHNWRPGGNPILFETMVFGEEHLTTIFGREHMMRDDLGMWRYETWDQAEAGHAKVVEMMRERIKQAEDAAKRLGRTVEGKGQ
jgi:hypothetical protein